MSTYRPTDAAFPYEHHALSSASEFGMNLRAYFAGQALVGLLSSGCTSQGIPEAAVILADNLIAALNNPLNEPSPK
jgi:hypothetical protein